jgi:peptidoglycan-associated lipoprotein
MAVGRRDEETGRMTGRSILAAAAVALALAGCARAPIDTGAGYGGAGADLGYSGGGAGAGLGVGGAAGAGTLPGSSISDRVFFATDQSTLSAAAIGTIDEQVGWLTANPGLPILIEGHADERGTEQYNLQLGARRASAVRDYMVSRGIPDARITTTTFGRARPVATCADDSCWSQNRRAVTVVSGPGA